MDAYEFYRGDEINGYHLIGILPERRKHLQRITEESIMNWVRMVLGDREDMSKIFFLKITIGRAKSEGEMENRREDVHGKILDFTECEESYSLSLGRVIAKIQSSQQKNT